MFNHCCDWDSAAGMTWFMQAQRTLLVRHLKHNAAAEDVNICSKISIKCC